MTFLRTKAGAFALPAAALSLSVFGLAAATSAESSDDDSALPPVQCEIQVEKSGRGYTWTGVLHADATVEGAYELNISSRSGGRTTISQGGSFMVKAGKTETLGQASLGGMDPDSVEAELILHMDGKSYVCGQKADL
ncbi:curli-like amyloid fiber formation chaperone CsgH [Psychromarinibacter sp. C21-152]|uniref:Curli-like amyloid fiber formation chaperone CsgH n=1 Tax=Psychromarinibacter sediminicola TaxID=3033385 RepID=A0AAE3NZB2_9RHOB|nr:curli-like amyloid fiber formation chaperone CsgH [Psychromarinibacter sediminicola]MDF0603660.1 curli-like amyloid fiber formation chaperone CsgH [Psychromarinibacter sediminicola]